jgi:predicted branched-subunit amino acid permease
LTALVTVVLLNIHFVMYGLSLSRVMPFTKKQRFAAGMLLTDAVYGMTMADARAGLFFLLGAEASMFVAWNLLTAVGLLLHHFAQTITLPPLDLVAPLSFCGMLMFTLKTRQEALVAAIAMGSAVIFNVLGLKSAVILLTTLVAVVAGLWLTRPQTVSEKGTI